MKVIKRDGKEVGFEPNKIHVAIQKAANDTPNCKMNSDDISSIVEKVYSEILELSRSVTVEEIQDLVERNIMTAGFYEVAQHYIRYRYEHSLLRKGNSTDSNILSIVEYDNELAKQENSNKDPEILPTQRDYIAGEVSKDISKRLLLPHDVVEAHNNGIIHFHDMDYFIQHAHNCCLVNLEDMLQNGTMISGTKIERPHSFSTACNIATQIVAQAASSQYGGQTISAAHLSPFVNETRKKMYAKHANLRSVLGEKYDSFIEDLVQEDIVRGVQTIQYQVITLMTTNGQAPFVTLYLDINECPEGQTREDHIRVIKEVLKQRLQGVKNEQGVWVTPAFPKLIYALDEDNVNPDSKYYEVTKLAAECTAKRMVPDYISKKIMRELKNGDTYPCMGCRSFLTPDISGLNPDGSHKYYGRFNCGVVTINLVDVALSSGKDMEKFWEIFDNRLELCHKALQCKHNRLRGTTSDVAPIMWQYGALARLEKGEVIDKLLFNNYSTISLGYAGLYECVKYMTGESHTSKEGHPFAVEVMKYMNDKCAKWRSEENISYSLYGTPIESTTYKFATCLQNRFGIIPEITDHNYITNSYHVNVREEIDAFTKLEFEAELQELSPGGAVSYVEVPNMQGNIPAVLAVIKYIYDHIMYAELNTKSDYCQVCGYDGEIKIVEDDGKLVWECPKCGNRDEHKLNVTRRTCGYLGTNFWNQGRTQEIQDRVMHL